jgi:hypothetical protein
MCKPQKVKRFGFSLTSLSSVVYRKSAKLNQAGLLGIHFQPKSPHALLQLTLKAFRILSVLKSYDKVIRIPHDDHFTLGAFLAPLLHPQIQNIMQVYVRKQWRNHCPLWRPNHGPGPLAFLGYPRP